MNTRVLCNREEIESLKEYRRELFNLQLEIERDMRNNSVGIKMKDVLDRLGGVARELLRVGVPLKRNHRDILEFVSEVGKAVGESYRLENKSDMKRLSAQDIYEYNKRLVCLIDRVIEV
ncbi:MAG: hypothetical protein NZ908_02660 [Candidatus Micrarchaeota archaeon]|nr:hypothetical protein [Candidatus Micrarchaeota archaeon]MCX8154336.1 hypothetical protein [Candidatus Micrarchaeota archaeon]